MGNGRDRFSAFSKIRVRLVLGFLAAFLGMALFGAFSYRFFTRMEDKLHFLSRADHLLNTVLEVRRYEKNYFLYQHQEDYQQALAYLDQVDEILAADGPRLSGSEGPPLSRDLLRQAGAYRQALAGVRELRLPSGPMANLENSQEVQALRAAGKGLIALCEEVASRERERIGGLLRDYRPFLIVFLMGLGLMVAGMVYLLLVRMVKPLQTIEEATRQVAHGDFRPIPWGPAHDEIGTLVQAFNRMVVELQENRAQMIQSEKLTSLGTLTSGVAHELNNPLNNISTSCQIMLEEMGQSSSDYHRELLTAIDQQVAKARDIVRSLLEFARQRDFVTRPEDLRAVVEDALKLIKGELAPRVQVGVEVPEGLTLMMDKAHMVQALLNLIQNGIQAMAGQGRLTIRAAANQEAREVVLQVEDSGPGIAPEVLPRIFDPFFTTKEVGQGTGLGLSITYGIVERHQGRVAVESKPGAGARFCVHLPLPAREV
ncbi:MAG: HAMP domain-containing histidine kinase [Desulfarculus sp.]|nr:HAMP domain-containing histidine kinase [Desulfarculus sp.]